MFSRVCCANKVGGSFLLKKKWLRARNTSSTGNVLKHQLFPQGGEGAKSNNVRSPDLQNTQFSPPYAQLGPRLHKRAYNETRLPGLNSTHSKDATGCAAGGQDGRKAEMALNSCDWPLRPETPQPMGFLYGPLG